MGGHGGPFHTTFVPFNHFRHWSGADGSGSCTGMADSEGRFSGNCQGAGFLFRFDRRKDRNQFLRKNAGSASGIESRTAGRYPEAIITDSWSPVFFPLSMATAKVPVRNGGFQA